MADKTITQLTAATTPLAGSEVLPIVQSGSTVKVSVANLTSGRSILVGSGTVGAPSIAPTGDPNTGVWFPAADTVAISTNGAEYFRVTSTGLVGVGATPAVKFEVNAAVDDAEYVRMGGASSPSTRALRFLSFNSGAASSGHAINAPSSVGVLTIQTVSLERLRIDASGNVIVNTAAVATNATNGFLYVSSCAGTPIGTPTAYTGRVPIVVDTTNNKLYFYSSGAWRDAGP